MYTAPFCCDRDDDGFNLQDFLPGKLYRIQESPTEEPKKATRSVSTLRPKSERTALEDKLVGWLTIQVKNDPDRRPSYEILSPEQMKILLRMQARAITSPSSIVEALHENEEWSEEWAGQLYTLISEFDRDLQATNAQAAEKKTALRANRAAEKGFIIQTAEDFIEGSNGNKRRKIV